MRTATGRQGASFNWAKSIGPCTAQVIEQQLTDRPHPEHGYRGCLGLLKLSRGYGKPRLEAACERALAIHSASYRSVASILKQGLDRQPLHDDQASQAELPLHQCPRPRLLPLIYTTRGDTMLNQHTVNSSMHLSSPPCSTPGTATGPAETHDLAFEERFALLVEREVLHRENRRLARLLKVARLRVNACVEDIDYRHPRGLQKPRMAALASGDWIRQASNLCLTGPTGCGKTWLACALGNQACRQGLSVRYLRLPTLLEQLRIATVTAAMCD